MLEQRVTLVMTAVWIPVLQFAPCWSRANHVYVQAGAGIVADSDPANEYQECVNKAQALLVAVDRAEQGLM